MVELWVAMMKTGWFRPAAIFSTFLCCSCPHQAPTTQLDIDYSVKENKKIYINYNPVFDKKGRVSRDLNLYFFLN